MDNHNTTTIELKNVTKTFNDLVVLNNINFVFDSKKTYSLSGVSGVGKSTLLHILAGLEKPSSGEILFNNKDINRISASEYQKILNQDFGLIFQEPCLIQEFTVLENIMLKASISGNKIPKNTITELLDITGLEDKTEAYPYQLSGGQQQRVSIARAIINKPKFILADEPTGNLDSKNAENIVNLLLDLNKYYSTGILISTHDLNLAAKTEIKLKLEGQKLFNAI